MNFNFNKEQKKKKKNVHPQKKRRKKISSRNSNPSHTNWIFFMQILQFHTNWIPIDTYPSISCMSL